MVCQMNKEEEKKGAKEKKTKQSRAANDEKAVAKHASKEPPARKEKKSRKEGKEVVAAEAVEAETEKVTRSEKPKKKRTRSRKGSGAAAKSGKPTVPAEPGAPVSQLAPEMPPAMKLKYGSGTSMYAHISSYRKNNFNKALGRTEWERLIRWRKEENYRTIEHPTRLDRARSLGYKAKQGVTLVRVRVRRGGLRKRRIAKGRRAKRKGILRITMKKNTQRMAEERVGKRYPNMEVLNSYPVGQDGMHRWFEVILVDPYSPSVQSDRHLNWLSNQTHSSRAFRGLTSAGKKGRGLRWRGKGVEKVRPSVRANDRKGK